MVFEEIVSRRLTALFVWLSVALGVAYLFIFEPGKSGFYPVCIFRELTGFTCPGCGSTRGLHRLLHGDVVGAFELNPLFILSLPFLIYFLLRYTNKIIRGEPIGRSNIKPKYFWILFLVILSFWIFRNTPLYPFVS
jgi:hypothetical protein